MVARANDAAQAVWDLSTTLSLVLAIARGDAAFEGEPIDEGREDRPPQVWAAEARLDVLAYANADLQG